MQTHYDAYATGDVRKHWGKIIKSARCECVCLSMLADPCTNIIVCDKVIQVSWDHEEHKFIYGMRAGSNFRLSLTDWTILLVDHIKEADIHIRGIMKELTFTCNKSEIRWRIRWRQSRCIVQNATMTSTWGSAGVEKVGLAVRHHRALRGAWDASGHDLFG